MADSGNESIDRNLNCVIKKAISLRVGNPSVEFKSGCSVIDVVFPGVKSVEVVYITIYCWIINVQTLQTCSYICFE